MMEKRTVASGESTEETPGTKVTTVQSQRLFVTKLLRKRATYARYFSAGLSLVDQALRRVEAFRAYSLNWENAKYSEGSRVGEVHRRGPALSPRHLLQAGKLVLSIRGKVSLKECGSKEKKKLKEYALRVKRRKVARLEHESTKKERRRLLAKRREEEARKRWEEEVAQRWTADEKAALEARNALFVSDPRGFEVLLRQEEAARRRARRERIAPYRVSRRETGGLEYWV